MNRRNGIGVLFAIAVAIAVFAFVGQAPAGGKHSHKTIQKYAQTAVFTPGGDIGSGTAFCPRGSVVTGGGEDYVDGLATVDMGLAGTNAYYVIVDNFDHVIPSQLNVQVACTAGTTKVKARAVSRAQVEDQVADMVAQREAAHRAEE